MKVIFAKNIGFCSGVKRAVLLAEKSLKKDPKPIQFLGNLVHNEKIIEKFKKRGVGFIKNLKEAKGTVIIQAHGAPPLSFSGKINNASEAKHRGETKSLRNLLFRDATCPLVKKAQLAAKALYEKGYKVVIIGDRNHSEVKGIKGYAKNKALVVANEIQAKKISYKKIGVVAQTTQNLDNVNKVLKTLKGKAKELEYLNTLCPEVQKRQDEMKSILLKKVDSVLVIGSKSSANTKRLVEKAKKSKKQIFWVNSLAELKKKNLKEIHFLGVISGTSASNEEIEKIRKYLKKGR